MTTTLIITDGITQINLTPETTADKVALAYLKSGMAINVAVKRGHFAEKENKPYGAHIGRTHGGFLRAFQTDESVMLVLTEPETTESE